MYTSISEIDRTVFNIKLPMGLRKQGIAVEAIAGEAERDRATVYRWLKGIKQRGIEGYIRHYRAVKKGHRRYKEHCYVVQRVQSIRRVYRDCYGLLFSSPASQTALVLPIS
jgi:predicted transcriptional regulator